MDAQLIELINGYYEQNIVYKSTMRISKKTHTFLNSTLNKLEIINAVIKLKRGKSLGKD